MERIKSLIQKKIEEEEEKSTMSTNTYNLTTNNKTNSLTGSSSVLFELVSLSSKKAGTHGTEPSKSIDGNALVRTELSPGCVPAFQISTENSVFVSIQSMQIAHFDNLFNLQAGFRVSSDGEVWHLVTPELLGWMLARIEIGLRAPAASEDLGAAIVLFHRARDASGFAPGPVPSSAWVPPGYGLRFPDLSDPVTGLYSRYQVSRIEGLRNWCGKNAHGEQATA